MLNAAEQSNKPAVSPSDHLEQSFTIYSLPDGRDAFNRKFWPLLKRITRLSGGNVRFGERDSYFVDLPGGNNPYAYHYDDDVAFAEIWQNIILAEHGWPSADVLEQMLLADAEYDEKENQVFHDRNSLSERNLKSFNRSCRVIDCQLKGRIIDKDPRVLFFAIADEYDVRPFSQSGGRHMVPYTEDGVVWLWTLARMGLKRRTKLKLSQDQDEQKRQKCAADFTKRLDSLWGTAIVKDFIRANNGVDMLFSHCDERLFFEYSDGGLSEFEHLSGKIHDFMYGDAAYGSVVEPIDRDVIREWFINDLKPLSDQAELPLFIESDRKYRFPASGSSRHRTFTLTNYRIVWRTLTNAIDKR